MKTPLAICITVMAVCGTLKADVILFEDFEDATLTYTSNLVDDFSDIASSNYFGRIAPDTATPPVDVSYGNPQGNGYYGAQDTDSAGSGNADVIELSWSGVDISSFTDLNLSWFVAEDDATDGNEDWDITTSVRLAVQIDGGGFVNIFAIESEDAVVGNRVPRVDTDFNMVGEGAEITDVFTQFSSAVSNGSVLDIRLTIEDLDTGDEDIAFDSLLLTGNVIPEPSTIILLFWGVCALACRRRSH